MLTDDRESSGMVLAGDDPGFIRAMASLRRTINAMPPDATPRDPEPSLQELTVRAYLDSVGLPHAYRSMKLSNFDTSTPARGFAHGKITRWVAGYRGRKNMNQCNLFLWSPGTGCGKSHLGVGAMREVIGRWTIHAKFFDSPELLARFRNFHDEDDIREYYEIPLMLLDDLGAERGTAAQKELLTVLLRNRMHHQRPTIITTNLVYPDQVAEYFSGRMISRLQEYFEIIEVNLPDFREHVGTWKPKSRGTTAKPLADWTAPEPPDPSGDPPSWKQADQDDLPW